MHLLKHLNFNSLVHGETHKRPHEWDGVCDTQSAEVVLSSILSPSWDEVLLLKPLLLITSKVDLPILKNLLLGELSLLL